MQYDRVVPAVFLQRLNRFVAEVRLNGITTAVHVKNTGRCRELLVPGATVWLSGSDNPARKTEYDLICVDKSGTLINMDSQIPNAAAAEWLPRSGLFPQDAVIRREVTRGRSRFDFSITAAGQTTWLEVKGVTLEQDGIALFPDAPTERGVKHLKELTDACRSGDGGCVLFVIQMKGVRRFLPHDAMHKDFGDALRTAAAHGVKILAMDCIVTPESIRIDRPVTVDLLPDPLPAGSLPQ